MIWAIILGAAQVTVRLKRKGKEMFFNFKNAYYPQQGNRTFLGTQRPLKTRKGRKEEPGTLRPLRFSESFASLLLPKSGAYEFTANIFRGFS